MERSQIPGALSRAFGKIACTLARTLPNVTASTSDIAPTASALLLIRLLLSLIRRCRRLTLAVRTHGECK
jgi:hypothetical protein